MKQYRLLRPDEIECRVQACKQNGLSLLLYKTARTDADLLDETVGADHWTNDFKLVDGVLYGGIGVDYGSGPVWKWDAGVESNTEAEKGRASDAFKRAGFKHGIGRELYSAPFIWIAADKCTIKENKGKYVCYDEFIVEEISYDPQQRISGLRISCKGRIVYDMGRHTQAEPPAEPAAKPSAEPPASTETKAPDPSMYFLCADCGEVLRPYKDQNGKAVGIRRIAESSKAKFGRVLCTKCATKASNENGG